MSPRCIATLALAGVLVASRSVHAESRPVSPAPSRAASPYAATLTLDVLALRFLPGSGPGAAFMSELYLAPRWSLALGAGLAKREVPTAQDPQAMTWGWDAIVEPRFYALGHFAGEGLHVGWLTSFARAIDGPVQSDIFVPAPGISMGPTLGVKSTSLPLIHVDVDAGPLFSIWQSAPAEGMSRVGLFLSFGIGRSF